ncbi:hypothetical protein SEA_NANOSMITE_150 [Mycobacterium phage Nanosmite]|nr:hypothetical protein SEA_NANOSMITE_150 [Mycobacterium phage Nanosmite]
MIDREEADMDLAREFREVTEAQQDWADYLIETGRIYQ